MKERLPAQRQTDVPSRRTRAKVTDQRHIQPVNQRHIQLVSIYGREVENNVRQERRRIWLGGGGRGGGVRKKIRGTCRRT